MKLCNLLRSLANKTGMIRCREYLVVVSFLVLFLLTAVFTACVPATGETAVIPPTRNEAPQQDAQQYAAEMGITPVPHVFMPQLKQRDDAFMTALLIGDLVVEAGCLRIRDIYTGESRLVIWQADYFLTDNNGVLAILDETGAVAAQVGERVFLGGGEQPALNETELRQPLPDSCGGPYWRMGNFLPEEYVPNVAADLPPPMQAYAGGELGLAFDYPLGWFVHEAGKSLQITPNAQPTWSSFFDPDQPHGGPTFDLLHNLNRQMGATPLAEIAILLEGFGDGIIALDPAKPLPHQPHIAVGLYRLADDEEMVLLLGAAANPLPDSLQPVVALSGVVRAEELGEMRIVFETILRTLRPADAPSP